jgi:hypothetical protein
MWTVTDTPSRTLAERSPLLPRCLPARCHRILFRRRAVAAGRRVLLILIWVAGLLTSMSPPPDRPLLPSQSLAVLGNTTRRSLHFMGGWRFTFTLDITARSWASPDRLRRKGIQSTELPMLLSKKKLPMKGTGPAELPKRAQAGPRDPN